MEFEILEITTLSKLPKVTKSYISESRNLSEWHYSQKIECYKKSSNVIYALCYCDKNFVSFDNHCTLNSGLVKATIS